MDDSIGAAGVSRSYVQPRSLAGYQEHFKPIGLDGVLELKVVPDDCVHSHFAWERYWFALTPKGFLYYLDAEEGKRASYLNFDKSKAKGVIPLETISRVRASTMIRLYAIKYVYYLKAENREDMIKWLFAFHRSVIDNLLEKLVRSRRLYNSWSNSSAELETWEPSPTPPPSSSQHQQPYQSRRSSMTSVTFALPPIQVLGAAEDLSRIETRDYLLSPRQFDSTKRIVEPPVDAKTPPQPSVQKYVPPHLRLQTNHHCDEDETSYQHSRQEHDHEEEEEMFFYLERQSSISRYSHLYGRCSEIGRRNSMEDFDVAIPDLREVAAHGNGNMMHLGFFAVYDGHCGSRVAQLASEVLHMHSCSHEDMFVPEKWPHGTQNAVNAAFDKVEAEFLQQATAVDPILQDGSCALVVVVQYSPKRAIAVANLGDSRAVLARNGGAVDLSKAHSPNRDDERQRIEQAGGWITSEREMLIGRLHHMDLDDPLIRQKAHDRMGFVEIFRVNGELAVSRALGDVEYKIPYQNHYPWFFPPDHPAYEPDNFNQTYTFTANLVDATPEWTLVDINDQDEFCIIACDGLWEVLDSDEAVQIVQKSGTDDLQQAAENLVKAALRMGSADNITAIVVSLSATKQ